MPARTDPPHALLGAMAVGGWVVADLVVFLTGPQPRSALVLLPGSLLALLVGAIAGAWLAGASTKRWTTIAAVVLALGALALLGHLAGGPVPAPIALLPFATLLLLGAMRVAPRIGAATWTAQLAAALGLGAIGWSLFHSLVALAAEGPDHVPNRWSITLPALLLVIASRLRSAALRRGVVATVLGSLALWLGGAALTGDALRRADLGPPPTASAAGPNLLLIVLDTVRADHLAPYGHERVTTPHLDEFARRHAVVYDHARATSSWTLPSHASLFTGRFPAAHGATHPRGDITQSVDIVIFPAVPLAADVPTLAGELRTTGYETAAIVGNSVYLRHEFGLGRGFEHWDDRLGTRLPVRYYALAQLSGRWQRPGHLGYRDAASVTARAIDWLDGRDTERPFFLFLNYMDAHAPYHPPEPYAGALDGRRPLDPRRPPRDLEPLIYDREILYVDSQLAVVLEQIERRGLLEDTLVVITSDHGEAFGEHGFRRHDWTLYEEVLEVPLYVKLPAGTEREAGRQERLAAGYRRDTTPTSGAALHHLIRRAMGLPPRPLPPSGLIGEWFQIADVDDWESRFDKRGQLHRDLLAWLEGDTKYIVSSTGEVEAYSLRLDPGELSPLTLSPRQRKAAVDRAAAWWQAHPPPDTPAPELDEESRRHLRALGYVN